MSDVKAPRARAKVSSSNLVGRSCGGQGNRTPQAASSRPTLRGRAQYPHWECPPKLRLRWSAFTAVSHWRSV